MHPESRQGQCFSVAAERKGRSAAESRQRCQLHRADRRRSHRTESCLRSASSLRSGRWLASSAAWRLNVISRADKRRDPCCLTAHPLPGALPSPAENALDGASAAYLAASAVRASRHWRPDWNWHERLARIRCMVWFGDFIWITPTQIAVRSASGDSLLFSSAHVAVNPCGVRSFSMRPFLCGKRSLRE